MIMMVYYYLPFMVLPLYSALERFDYPLDRSLLRFGSEQHADISQDPPAAHLARG